MATPTAFFRTVTADFREGFSVLVTSSRLFRIDAAAFSAVVC